MWKRSRRMQCEEGDGKQRMGEKKVGKERKTEDNLCVCVCMPERETGRQREVNVCEKQRVREASVTDSAEAAAKGSSNTAGGEKIGAKQPEGYTLLEEREGGREEGRRATGIQS